MVRGVAIGTAIMVLAAGNVWAKDELQKRAAALFKPVPRQATAEKVNHDRINLGRMLYFDPRLSSSQLISCNTCHNVGLGGIDLQETSIGHGWQKGPRNAPTVLNAVFNVAQFWDGRAIDLKEQAKGPVQASVEMNNTPAQVIATLKSIPGYAAPFRKAFPKEGDPITFDNIAKAIEDFEATLITPDAPFDKYLRGDGKALNQKQLDGLRLFVEKGCAACHNGVNVGGSGYFPFGVVERPDGYILPAGDMGRFKVTNTSSDQYVFKSPSLRNISMTQPYFHSGKVWRLRDAVGLMGSAQLGIKLSDEEGDRIVAFLSSLTGTQPRIEYPLLPSGGDATPQPVVK